MHATIRNYEDRRLADLLASRREDIEALMAGVPGIRGYYLVRTDAGCASITVCDDEDGTRESSRMAADWIRENAADIAPARPTVAEGEVVAAHAAVVAA